MPPEITPVPHNVVAHTVDDARIVELNRINAGAQPISRPTGKQPSLSDSLASVTNDEMSFSKSGAGGALLLIPKDKSQTGSAIKVESAESCKAAQKCAQLMENFYEHAQGPQPFAAPRINMMTAEELQKQPELLQKLTDAHRIAFNKGDAEQKDQIESARERVRGLGMADYKTAEGLAGELGVSTMEFAKGKQLNQMPLDEKLALVKGGDFAKTMGRSMAPLMAMGMNDHIGAGSSDAFGTNPTNFLYDSKTGQLSVIDYSSGQDPDANNNLRISRHSGGKSLKEVNDSLTEAFSSDENFEKCMEGMLNRDGRQGVGVQTTLGRTMRPFVTSGFNNFFSSEENPQSTTGTKVGKSGKVLDVKEGPVDLALSRDDKERFAANMMSGVLDGIEYMQKNEQALRTAVKATHETVNGQKVEHFYNEQELDDFCKEVRAIDVNKLRYNLGERVKGMEQKRDQRIDARVDELGTRGKEITDRLKRLEKKIDRMENHPTFKDKVQDFLDGKAKHPSDKPRAEKAQLLQEAADIQKEANALSNQKGLNAHLKESVENPHPKQTQQQGTRHSVREETHIREEETQGLTQKKKVELGANREKQKATENVGGDDTAETNAPKVKSTRSKILTGTHKLELAPEVHSHGVR